MITKSNEIVSTTGYTSRELYQIRLDNDFKLGKDFYMVGGTCNWCCFRFVVEK